MAAKCHSLLPALYTMAIYCYVSHSSCTLQIYNLAKIQFFAVIAVLCKVKILGPYSNWTYLQCSFHGLLTFLEKLLIAKKNPVVSYIDLQARYL